MELGQARPPQLFENQPNILIFDRHEFLADPHLDLKPFARIANIEHSENAFTEKLRSPSKDFTVAIVLPQSNDQQVLQFVQETVLQYPSTRSFVLFFVIGDEAHVTSVCGTGLIGCHPISSRISHQVRAVCATANDRNIAYCEDYRVQHERQGDIGVAYLFAVQNRDRLRLQLQYNQQLRREFQERLFA